MDGSCFIASSIVREETFGVVKDENGDGSWHGFDRSWVVSRSLLKKFTGLRTML